MELFRVTITNTAKKYDLNFVEQFIRPTQGAEKVECIRTGVGWFGHKVKAGRRLNTWPWCGSVPSSLRWRSCGSKIGWVDLFLELNVEESVRNTIIGKSFTYL